MILSWTCIWAIATVFVHKLTQAECSQVSTSNLWNWVKQLPCLWSRKLWEIKEVCNHTLLLFFKWCIIIDVLSCVYSVLWLVFSLLSWWIKSMKTHVKKVSVQIHKKSVSLAAKLNVIWCITQECQISVCKALDLTEGDHLYKLFWRTTLIKKTPCQQILIFICFNKTKCYILFIKCMSLLCI